jgi:hypothetical protein
VDQLDDILGKFDEAGCTADTHVRHDDIRQLSSRVHPAARPMKIRSESELRAKPGEISNATAGLVQECVLLMRDTRIRNDRLHCEVHCSELSILRRV